MATSVDSDFFYFFDLFNLRFALVSLFFFCSLEVCLLLIRSRKFVEKYFCGLIYVAIVSLVRTVYVIRVLCYLCIHLDVEQNLQRGTVWRYLPSHHIVYAF